MPVQGQGSVAGERDTHLAFLHQQICSCLKTFSHARPVVSDTQKWLHARSRLIQNRQRSVSICVAGVIRYGREAGTRDKLGTVWGAGVGGNGGNGGSVSQQSDTTQTGHGNSGKTFRPHAARIVSW